MSSSERSGTLQKRGASRMGTEDFSQEGLAYPPGWNSWEGRKTTWPRLRAYYALFLPGPTALGLLALNSSSDSGLLVLLAPLAIVVLIEGARHFWRAEPGFNELVLFQLPTILAVLAFFAAARWIPRDVLNFPLVFALPALALLGLLFLGRGPIALYKRYLYAFPAATQEMRARPQRLTYLPPALALALILGAGVWLASQGSGLAIIVPVVLACLFIAWPPRLITRGARVLAFYLRAQSPFDATMAPGVWFAPTPRRGRIMAWNLQAALVSIACAALAPLLLRDTALQAFIATSTPVQALDPRLLAAIAACTIALPALFLLGAYAPALWSLDRLKGRLLAKATTENRTPWECVVDRVRLSPLEWRDSEGRLIRERDHLFIGFSQAGGAPILLHRAALEEHAYISGRSGAGKTSRALMPLLIQLIRGRAAEEDTPPILVLDLKGDLALFNTAREEAQKKRADGSDAKEFRFFTLDSARPAHRFNPLETFCSRPRQSLELANQLLEALSLDYGDQYGRSFYAGGSREMLEVALREDESRRGFAELYEKVAEDKASKKFEIRAKLHALSGYEQLRSSESVPAINMHEVLERRELVYFFLDSASGAIGAREVARLALFALLDAAIQRQKEGKPARRAYVVIDEFQVVATVNIQQVVQQARSHGISLILANQSPQDLLVEGTNLLSVVQTNTRFKQYFSVNEAEALREMSAMSGEKVVHFASHGTSEGFTPTGGTSSTTTNWKPMVRPTLEPNEILEASAAEAGAIVHLATSYGMSNFGGVFTPILAPHCLPPEVYRERARTPVLPLVPSPMPATERAPQKPSERQRTLFPEPPAAIEKPRSAEREAPQPAKPAADGPLEDLKLQRSERLRALFELLESAEKGTPQK